MIYACGRRYDDGGRRIPLRRRHRRLAVEFGAVTKTSGILSYFGICNASYLSSRITMRRNNYDGQMGTWDKEEVVDKKWDAKLVGLDMSSLRKIICFTGKSGNKNAFFNLADHVYRVNYVRFLDL